MLQYSLASNYNSAKIYESIFMLLMMMRMRNSFLIAFANNFFDMCVPFAIFLNKAA